MRNFRISLIAAAISSALLAAPILANAATTTTPQVKSGTGMMAGGRQGSNMTGGNMQGMMGMMAMMNACTRVMNKVADNMGHGTMSAHSGGMMNNSTPKKS